MREIATTEITETVKRLFQEANYYLPEDVLSALNQEQPDGVVAAMSGMLGSR